MQITPRVLIRETAASFVPSLQTWKCLEADNYCSRSRARTVSKLLVDGGNASYGSRLNYIRFVVGQLETEMAGSTSIGAGDPRAVHVLHSSFV
jgi:hypothetical protein